MSLPLFVALTTIYLVIGLVSLLVTQPFGSPMGLGDWHIKHVGGMAFDPDFFRVYLTSIAKNGTSIDGTFKSPSVCLIQTLSFSSGSRLKMT
jgi:hypothetical protein